MKNIIAKIAVLLFMIMSVAHLSAEEKPVDTDGNWNNDRIRSLAPKPARPIVYLNGNTLSIHLPEALSDLSIVITNDAGNIVYQECISTNQLDEKHSISLISYPVGEYTIMLSHHYRYLVGEFEMLPQ